MNCKGIFIDVLLNVVLVQECLQLSDCPNGFVHLNNQCYKLLSPSLIELQLLACHNSRGQLLQISPSDPFSETVAKYLMNLFSVDSVFAGNCQETKITLIRDEAYGSQFMAFVILMIFKALKQFKWRIQDVEILNAPVQFFIMAFWNLM